MIARDGRFPGGAALVVLTVLAVVAAVAVAPAAVVAQDEDEPDSEPTLPAAYHGELTIDGDDAPEGATVEAVVDGEVVGSIEVDEAGYYGSEDGGESRLVVPGETNDTGAEVSFYVTADGYERGQAAPQPAPVEWEPADVRRVDLQADLDATSSGGGGFGGGGFGGGGAGDDPSAGEDVAGPTALVDVTPDPADVGEAVTVSAADSTSDGEITDYEWSIAGESASGETATATFDSAGVYNLELTVTTEDGESDTASATVTVVEPDDDQGPAAELSVDPAEPTVGEDVTLSAADSSTPEGELTGYEWSVDGETYTGEEVSHAFEAAGTYTVELTVTNDAGATDSASETVTVGEGDDGSPGFGPAVAVIALLSVAAVAARRQ